MTATQVGKQGVEPDASKLWFLWSILVSSGLLFFPTFATAQNAPYPPSSVVESMSFDFNSDFQRGNFSDMAGSDQWPMTWADDGNVYAVWGDGVGWNQTGTRYFMGVTQIQGNPPSLFGVDQWGSNDQNRKPAGIVADTNQIMYLLYSTPDDNWSGSFGGMSTDNGRTWNFGFSKVFDRDTDGAAVTGIAQFGPGYSNIPPAIDGRYFYIYLRDPSGQAVYLGRVPKAEIFNRSAYTYFTGTDGSNNPNWSSDFSSKHPVFFDPVGMEFHVNVSYNPGIRRFIYAKGHNMSGLAIFEGPTPWGPWRTVYYGQFKDSFLKFTYQFPQKWMSPDGLTMWMAWSGWPEYDNVNFVKASLSLKNGSGDVTPPKAPQGLIVQ